MSEEVAPAPPGAPRTSTGNADLNRMLDGGLVPHRPYLLVGPAGTGKTTLALQFLIDGVRHGERVLFVTVEEPPNEILWNHRALLPELGRVEVFDAIPDVMRFERTPFKDIASVRSSIPFEKVDLSIRQTPELTSVEVTISALEQMLRTEVQRKSYSRVVVDSLTALQYFCMKGYEPGLGAQSFLRFLSDLQVTTLLTVESPLEDVESPERMLARGEIRLFRWELDGVTVRAVGVEKFRGSSHDVRLHPYRIGARGLDINFAATMSRDTQHVVAAPTPDTVTGEPTLNEPTPVEVLEHEVRDQILIGADTSRVRSEVEAALAASRQGEVPEAAMHLTLALAAGSVAPEGAELLHRMMTAPGEAALARIMARAESTRVGVPPARLPEPPILSAQLARVLSLLAANPPPAASAAALRPAAAVVAQEPVRPVAAAAPAPAPAPAAVPEPALASAPAAPVPPKADRPSTPTPAPPPAEDVQPAVPVPPGTAPAPTPRAAARSEPALPTPSERPPPPAEPPAPPPSVPSTPIAPAPKVPTRIRSEPPPLPTPGTLPEFPTPVPAAPADSRAGGVPAATEPAPPAAGPAGDTPAPAPDAAGPAARRKKRTTSSVRKKAPEVPTPAPSPEVPVEPEVSPVAPPPSAAEPATGESPVAKPKRRVVRKKRAPSVVAATPGPVPPGVYGTEPGPSSGAGEPPASEGS